MGVSSSRAASASVPVPVGYAGLLAEAKTNPDPQLRQVLAAASLYLFQPLEFVPVEQQLTFLQQIDDILPRYRPRIEAAAARAGHREVINLDTATPSLLVYVLVGYLQEIELVSSPAAAERARQKELRKLVAGLFFLSRWTGIKITIRGVPRELLDTREKMESTLLLLAVSRIIQTVGTSPGEVEMTVAPTEAVFFEYVDENGAKERIMINGGRMRESRFYDPPLTSVAHLWGVAKDQADLGVELVDDNIIGKGGYGTVYAKKKPRGNLAVKLFIYPDKKDKNDKKEKQDPWNKDVDVLSELFAWQYLTFTQEIARDVDQKRPFIVPINGLGVVGSLYRRRDDSIMRYMDPLFFSQDKLAVSMPLYNTTLIDWIQAGHRNKMHTYRECLDLQIAAQFAAALAWMHAQNAMHGDVKPDNVLVNYTPGVKDADIDTPEFLASFWLSLCDFSTTSIIDDNTLKEYCRRKLHTIPVETPTRLELKHSFMGTIDYMAPECMLTMPIPLPMLPRADVFSYGMTLKTLIVPDMPIRSPLDGKILDYLYAIGYGTADLTTHYLGLVLDMARTPQKDPRIKSAFAKGVLKKTLEFNIQDLRAWLKELETSDAPFFQNLMKINDVLLVNALMEPDYRRRPAMRVVAFALGKAAKAALALASSSANHPQRLRDMTVTDIAQYTVGLPHDVSESIRRRKTQWEPYDDPALLAQWKTMLNNIEVEAKKHGVEV